MIVRPGASRFGFGLVTEQRDRRLHAQEERRAFVQHNAFEIRFCDRLTGSTDLPAIRSLL